MELVKINWKSERNGRFWLGVSHEEGNFFVKGLVEIANPDFFESLEVGEEIEVPKNAIS